MLNLRKSLLLKTNNLTEPVWLGFIMSQRGELSLLENKVQGQSSTGTVPSLQHLLDVISSIIAEEYIMIAKQNPEVFIKQGETK